MLHDGGKRHGEGPGKFAHRNVLLIPKPGEERPPRRVGEGGEGAVENGVLMLNHLVRC
jgi:hypothetical protein